MIRPARRRVVGLAVLVLAAAAVALLLAPHSPSGLRALAASAGPAAPLALLAAWVLLTPALFPGTALAAATGLLLGPRVGIPLALAGGTLGAVVAFAAARAAAGTAAEQLAPRRIRSLQERLERRPVLGLAALRAAPGVPAALLNYAAGLSRVRARHFVAGITLGGAPRIVAYTALGGGIGHATSPAAIAIAVAVVAASAVSSALVYRKLRAAAGSGAASSSTTAAGAKPSAPMPAPVYGS